MTTATAGELLDLSAAAATLPMGRGGAPIVRTTLFRWIKIGIRGPDRRIVRLRATRVGSRWLTTREWLDDFTKALMPQFDDEPAPAA